jgi:hypothetical protein
MLVPCSARTVPQKRPQGELERASATLWRLCGAQDDHAIQSVIGYDAFSTFVVGRHKEMSSSS